jgi:uncharacterized phage-like protein YoqJ
MIFLPNLQVIKTIARLPEGRTGFEPWAARVVTHLQERQPPDLISKFV